MSAISIRDLNGMPEFEAAENLQLAVWGTDDRPDPADLMMVVAQEGGLVAGAFDGETLVGYIFGFPTKNATIQHSHRLAVLPHARGAGLAAKLKWYQRDWCLARGIETMRWTYDPLRAVNANLNIHRLGCTAGTYFENYYGVMAGINQGAPSDRLLAEWCLRSPQVQARANATPIDAIQPQQTITIPADFGAILANDETLALSERLRVRAAMTKAFGQGLRLVGFDAARCAYLLA